MKKKYSIIVLFLFIVLLITPCATSKAASYLKIKMNGSVTNYKGAQVKVKLDNSSINISNTPGIIVNGIALLPYQDVFKKGLGATCSYNATTGVITIKKYNNTVKLTIGSKIAYVNGTKKNVSAAPRKIYYYKSKTTKVMVPSRFVAEALGYTYYWASSTSTVMMTTPYALYYDSAWHIYKGSKGSVKINDTSIDVSNMPTVIFSNSAFVQARKVFSNNQLDTTYAYNSSNKTITISNDTATIVYKLNSTTAYVNNVKATLKTAPKLIKDNVTNKSCVMIPAKLTAESLGYDYTWNSTTKTSQIAMTTKSIWSWIDDSDINEIYNNRLDAIELEEKDSEEHITLTGSSSLGVQSSFDEENNLLTLTISNLSNMNDTLQETITSSANVQEITISSCVEGVLTITLQLYDETSYYESIVGNDYTIHFCTTRSVVTDDTITLPIPENVSFSDIQDEDRYYNKQFRITIPGDYVSYYQNLSATLPEGISKAQCTLNSSGNTVLTFTTTKILGYRLSQEGENFTITVGNPSDIYSSIVLLDAGHGGTDPGCVGHGLNEKDINYNILYKYGKSYFTNSSPVKAYWTRTTDTKIELADRAAFAKTVEADIFISLHMNAASSTSVNGAETYYCTSNNSKNSFGVTSKMLANYFQTNWPSQLGISTSRGVKSANYVVIKKNTVPAILIELGFMTGTKDINIIGANTTQKTAAKTFYNTVCEFFEKYPTGR